VSIITWLKAAHVRVVTISFSVRSSEDNYIFFDIPAVKLTISLLFTRRKVEHSPIVYIARRFPAPKQSGKRNVMGHSLTLVEIKNRGRVFDST
jgi:hypothetical protein